jgi:hypothetical protein
VAVASLCLGGFGGVARAGQYHVYSCRMPSGQVAPTDGWSGSTGGNATADTVSDTCESGGGLVAGLKAGVVHPADKYLAAWAFEAPTGESIAAATLWRFGSLPGGANSNASYLFWLAGSATEGDNINVFGTCAANGGCAGQGELNAPLGIANRVRVEEPDLRTPYLSLNVFCGSSIPEYDCPSGSGDARGYAAVVELFAADLVLEQTGSPTVSNVEGALTDAPTIGGTTDVAFDASDPGSGVYEALFSVDGHLVQSRVLSDNEGRCRDVGQTSDGLPAFLYARPCPASLSADVPFDTTGLPNGNHHLTVSVIDAAGNAATVLEREVTVANAGSANGEAPGRGAGNGNGSTEHATLTAGWHGARGAHLVSDYGSAPTMQGRLTNAAGQAIADAIVEVSALPSYLGAHPQTLPSLRTDASGRWSMRLARSVSSCTLRLAYRSHLEDPQPAATRTLVLGVRAGVTLRVDPRVTSVGRVIRFSGRLLGGPIPPGGKQLVLEAAGSPGGPWLEFHVIRSDAHGRFHSSHEFRYPGPAKYRFRVVSRYEADYPFEAGVSNVVGVRER